MNRKMAIVIGLALAASAGQARGAAPAAVGIKEFKFAPAALEVPLGTTVTWVNHDEETHTITSTTGAFASRGLGNDETFTQAFTRPGKYEYFCALHPKMRAAVIVK
ncbi:MAG TPA: cupredoxin family copper-binding protein [Methylomirabilota bacterium]|nr:cupredoxin family copper-binding protein [Methylomirabilota bacterium]